ncbi:transcription termination factor NusA [Weissella cibaria]|uniref:transcription termination factor NusA n=1 Tax=Weissella cibaria TaxID=137591 RepID=UPI0007A6263E|nr:transcription termination factor NusA [Weissella cibaria]QDG80173.1 transcription termination/antitermination protein NusA [Weissella cibaria]QMU87644.1 transcription termination/antitermination protein NusA [Weissella cibaria]TVV35991.1 transcription termination/antitermination protein NusA [Weissella cibaria]
MSKELVNALDALEQEKGIKAEVLVEAIEEALKKAYEKNYDESENVEVQFDQKKGNIKVYSVKTVVEEIDEPYEQITLEEALELNKAYEIGDEIRFEVTPADFGRLAAQTAKQIIMQKVREAERGVVYDKFIGYENEVITGEVERQDSRFLYIILPGNQEAAMKQGDQMPNESYRMGDKIKVLVSQVQNEQKGPQVFVSRTHPELVKRLFEAEVPEVFDGTVEIKSIAREAGDRSKIAVYSHNSNLDAVGTMVGQRGARVQAVVTELSGENMDIVEWTEDPAQFIKNALNPAEVVDVIFDPTNDRAVTVLVPDYQLSLAIGKRGQNARLAARLTGFKIDIKPESERDAVVTDMANKENEAANAPVIEADVADDFEASEEA